MKYFMELSSDEIKKNFIEIFRFEPFFNHAGNCYTVRRIGKVYDFYTLDQMDFIENPFETKLSEEDNIKGHWFQDVSETINSYLFKGLKQGRITKEIYDLHKKEDIFLMCDEKDNTLLYTLKCPKCGEVNRIHLKKDFSSFAGTVPSCKFCGEYDISVESRYKYESVLDDEIYISSNITGGSFKYKLHKLYPVLNESEEDRRERIVELSIKDTSDISLDYEIKKDIARKVYMGNSTFMHLVPDILRKYEEECDKDKVLNIIDSLTYIENANSFMNKFGISTKFSNPSPVVPGVLVQTGFNDLFSVNNTVPEEEKKEVKKDSTFCKACGAKVSGKFCPVCGTLV